MEYQYKEIKFSPGDLAMEVKFMGGETKYLTQYLQELSIEGWEYVDKISHDIILVRKRVER